MRNHVVLLLSALFIAFLSTGCLLEPLSAEEVEWLLEAQAEEDQALEEEALDANQGEQTKSTPWFVSNGHRDAANPGSQGTHPTSSHASNDGKPDPTPWYPLSECEKSDPRSFYRSVHKPDPTPW